MKTPIVLSNSPRRPSSVRQRLVYFEVLRLPVDNSLVSHQNNQNRYLRVYEPLANIMDPGIMLHFMLYCVNYIDSIWNTLFTATNHETRNRIWK